MLSKKKKLFLCLVLGLVLGLGLGLGFQVFYVNSSDSKSSRSDSWYSFVGVKNFFDSAKENVCFFWQFMCNRGEVGAILPSSPELAQAMTEPLASSKINDEIRVLEVGPGTGAFTKKIIEILQKKYPGKFIFDVVEINEDFYKKLKEKYGHIKGVNIHHGSIIGWKPDYKYYFIISGLPLNSLPYDVVDGVLSGYEKWIKKGGVISYFEYTCSKKWRVRELKFKKFLNMPLCRCEKYKKKLQEYHKIVQRVEDFSKDRDVKKNLVEENIPDAWAIHVQF